MARSPVAAFVVAVLACVSACNKDNPYYCKGAPEDNCIRIDGAGPPCSDDGDCAAPFGICDDDEKKCVQCNASNAEACGGEAPVCREKQCVACSAHTDCGAALACLPSGACGTDDNVAYVDPNGTDNATCVVGAKCNTIGAALATNKPYVKISGTIDEAVTIDGGRNVTFLAAPGAKLTRSAGSGPVLMVQGENTTLAVYDLSISDGPNNVNGLGLVVPPGSASVVELHRVTISGNRGTGISVGGGALTLTRSTVSGNVGGGVKVDNAKFVIVGNVIVANGTASTTAGGVSISTQPDSGNTLEFNTIHGNAAASPSGTGVHCAAGPSFIARNNIISDNGSSSNMLQITGSCAYRYSIVRPGAVPAGMGNLDGDPQFENPATGDYHIKAGSPAVRAADPETIFGPFNERDIDGHRRTNPADIGADQRP